MQNRFKTNLMFKYLLLIFSVFLIIEGNAQGKQGSWRDYLSYAEATKIAISPDKVYCASSGGLFFYDLQDNSVNKVSDFMNLSDFGIKTIAYNAAYDVLVVAYNNSNIDLIYSDRIVNLSDIKRKQITTDKTINNITFFGDEAWLSCGFGIVIINMERQEIKDTYVLGEGGATLGINDVEADGPNVYAASNKGILKAPLDGTDLADYRNWEQITTIPFYTEKFSFLSFFGGSLIANYTPDQYDQDKMYRLIGDQWIEYHPQIRYVGDMQSNGNYLVLTSRETVYLIDNNHTVLGSLNYYQLGNIKVSPISPLSASISANGILFIADFKNAMIKSSGENFESILPTGPIDNQIFSMVSDKGILWIAAGGHGESWNNSGLQPSFQRFGNGEWQYYNQTNYPEMDGFFDVISIAVDPRDPNHIFAGSWGGGVLEYRNNELISRYTNKNSPLETAIPAQPDAPYVRIGGLDFDSQGNLWITNSEVAQNLHRLTPDGEWTSVTLPGVANSLNIGQVLVNRYDDKWIVVPRGHDAYVVNKDGTQKKRLLVTSYFNNGQNEILNRMNDIYSIAEDNDGAIWIGTSKGVAVYTSPSRIWDGDTFLATQPSLDLNDGLYHPLLENETVSAIAVDGANRKWLGTKNSGVYLVSETGTEEILHFTTNDSPLFSDNITSIEINQKSGEVFIGTDQGLISYMGEATEGKSTYDSVYVYPNPVRETYNGPVTITNLINNSEVKITDIAGNLVFRTQSLGGQAIWDGRNLNGRRVKTGVYLVFCNDENGEETHITKLLFIH